MRREEEDVKDLPLDGKRGWTPPRHPLREDYPGFYYDDSVEEYLPLISWEDVPLKDGEVLLHHHPLHHHHHPPLHHHHHPLLHHLQEKEKDAKRPTSGSEDPGISEIGSSDPVLRFKNNIIFIIFK